MVTEFTNPQIRPVEFNPFSGPEIAYVAPSTEPQLEIWTACLVGGDDATRAYNLLISLRLIGPFHRPAMEQAIQALVQQHDALRSVFSANGEHICVLKDVSTEIPYLDISEKTSNEKDSLITDYLTKAASQVIDLLHGPLFMAGLLKLADQEHRLVLMSHHSISDGWSMGVILQDLGALYSAYAQGISPRLPETPSFAQYADEQRTFFKSGEYGQIEKFWVDKFKENVLPFDLPTDFTRPELRTFNSKRLEYRLDNDLVSAVKKMGYKAGCSFVTTLLTAFGVLLHRISGQKDITVGLPTAGQSITNNNRLVGHCVNLLPLKSHLDPKTKFSDFLKTNKESVFDAYEHQRLTFSSLFKKINIPRDPSKLPLIPVVFNVDTGMNTGINFYNLAHQFISHPKEYENFEWFFNVCEVEKSLNIEWSYNPHLFKAETIDQMMVNFETILKAVVADPDILVDTINIKSEHNYVEKLTRWNNTTAQYPRHLFLPALIAQTATSYPKKIAIRYNEQVLSYQFLNETANQLAHYLIQKELKVGAIVGIFLDRSPEMLITLLAVLKAGAAYLPLDPDYPHDRLMFMLADSSADMLITSKKFSGIIHSQAKQVLLDDALLASTYYAKTEPHVSVSSTSLAYVLYTSGSTGRPKGVLIDHRNLVNFLYSMVQQPGISQHDILLAVTTISFDIAGLELYLPLLVGATILLADKTTGRDGRALLDLLTHEQVSLMQATPSTWQMILNAGWDNPLPVKILCGGEALSRDLAEALLTKCSELWNMYGPTETTIWSTIKQIKNAETITIGRPIHNTQVYILDEYQKPVAEGGIGELYIAGDGVARGYLNRPELTAEKFVKNLFQQSKKSRMYRTGDLGRFAENGEIQYLGRIDQQVKIRGHRVELSEIAYVLNARDDIQEAVVIAREYSPLDQRLIAYIVPQSIKFSVTNGRGIAQEEQIEKWKHHIRLKLPAYMVPNSFVILPKIPLTPNGKLDKNALPEPATAGVGVHDNYVAPRTDIEKIVADIWMKCLKLGKVSVFDNFFQLGGHSLDAVRVMTLLEKETGKRLPLSTLFEYSTVEKLALALQMDGWSITWDTLVPIKPQGTKTPLYIIHGSGLHVLLFNVLAKYMDADQPIYGLQAKGINSDDAPHESIEEMAAYYVNSIMKNNPNGPYCLAGYSFGGMIAYEVSKQLLKKGKEVKLLAMFDTYADQSYYYDPWLRKMGRTSLNLLKERLYVLTMIKENPREILVSKGASLRLKLTRLYQKLLGEQITLKELSSDNYHKVRKTNQLAARKYYLVPLPICVDVFRAKKRSYYMDDFAFLGWKPFAMKGVNVHEVPGDHFNLFNAPNDKEFAQILQKVLNNY